MLGVEVRQNRTISTFEHKKVTESEGTKREEYFDGYTCFFYPNGDIRQVYPDKRQVYYFKEAKITQTDYANGNRVVLFSNG